MRNFGLNHFFSHEIKASVTAPLFLPHEIKARVSVPLTVSSLFLLILAISCTFFLQGCSFRPPEPCIKKGRKYGVIKNLIVNNKWYSCYQRGLSYSEGGCWGQAIGQFRKAIDQRSGDQWRARSYGMHILDEYFPHRELGIVYLHKGHIQDAIQELTLSLSFTDSGKARYYLNKARKIWLEKTDLDKIPPRIQFPGQKGKPGDLIYTSSSSYNIKAIATDDYFISRILINDHPLFFDLALPKISFQKDIHLEPGINTVKFKAEDLTGKECREEILILLDQQGPTLFFSPAGSSVTGDREWPFDFPASPDSPASTAYSDSPAYSESPVTSTISLNGLAFDKGGLKRLIINEKEIPVTEGETIKEFSCDISFTSHPAFFAIDCAGNITEGILNWPWEEEAVKSLSIDKRQDTMASSGNKGIRICHSGDYFPLNSPQDTESPHEKEPRIFLEECPSLVYNPVVVFTGWVESTKEVSGFWINDESLLSMEENKGFASLLRRFFLKGRTVFYFTYRNDKLTEGENNFTFNAKDIKGKVVQKAITVKYRKRNIERPGSRWQMAIFPFLKQRKADYLFSPSPPRSMDVLDMEIEKSFSDTRRFMLLNRRQIDIIIQQLNLQLNDLVDEKTASSVGGFLRAEVLLTGFMYEGWDGQDRCLEIIARLVDADTSQILSTKSVYNRWKTRQDEEFLLKGLASLFVQEFPVLQGEVMDITRKRLKIDLAFDDLIKNGMRIIVYSPEEDTILGQARIEEVLKEYSYTCPIQDNIIKDIQAGDKIITK